MDIVLSGINKSYDDSGSPRTIFNGLTACFPSGKISVIMGKSGVGKSSLLNLISGIDLPDSGDITAGGHALTGMTDSRRTIFRRRHMGFIFQSFHLIPVLTVLENAALVSELDGVSRKKCRDTAMALLSKVGLGDRAHDFPDRLSGGEQQRVAIVRALVNDPAVLLADEPTGNLDQETGTRIMDLIADLSRKEGKTLIMVTHSPDAAAYAHRIFTVENKGLVLKTGPGAVF